MKIDIYIITLWKGSNFAKGSGAYGILLEVVKDGTPYTKEHYAGWENLSYPKLQLRAAVGTGQALLYRRDNAGV